MTRLWLRGQEHTRLGAVETACSDHAALAISMGGAGKPYAYTDPNEDAALLVVGPQGTLLAVADGHGGCEASASALETLGEIEASAWTHGDGPAPDAWPRAALGVLARLNQAILAPAGAKRHARTTLALALLLPARRELLVASVGDSHVFRVEADRAVELNRPTSRSGRTYFLGSVPETTETLAEKCALAVEPLGTTCAVVLATDGLSEIGIGLDEPASAVLEAAEAAGRLAGAMRARRLALGVMDRALSAHRRNGAGDNLACAVLWTRP